jgi:hypothetical protein
MPRLATLAFLGLGLAACDSGGAVAGRVVDAITGIGIAGVQVSCLDDGAAVATIGTGASGEFSFAEEFDCSQLLVVDVDGPANGSYADVVVFAWRTRIELTPR